MRVLALNCRSSSIRGAVVDTPSGDRTASRNEALAERSHEAVLADWVAGWQDARRHEVENLEAIGHRVVHGGENFSEPVRIEGDVVDQIASLSRWAPLHNPANLTGSRATVTDAIEFLDQPIDNASVSPVSPLGLAEEIRFNQVSFRYLGVCYNRAA